MTKTQAGRYLTLAWFLRTQVPRKHFDMGYYCKTKDNKSVDLRNPSCGTSACALGWCTVVWPKRFKLVRANNNFCSQGLLVVLDGAKCDFNNPNLLLLNFFGGAESDFEYVFGPHTRTPKQEAAVIEQLVRKYGWKYEQ